MAPAFGFRSTGGQPEALCRCYERCIPLAFIPKGPPLPQFRDRIGEGKASVRLRQAVRTNLRPAPAVHTPGSCGFAAGTGDITCPNPCACGVPYCGRSNWIPATDTGRENRHFRLYASHPEYVAAQSGPDPGFEAKRHLGRLASAPFRPLSPVPHRPHVPIRVWPYGRRSPNPNPDSPVCQPRQRSFRSSVPRSGPLPARGSRPKGIRSSLCL